MSTPDEDRNERVFETCQKRVTSPLLRLFSTYGRPEAVLGGLARDVPRGIPDPVMVDASEGLAEQVDTIPGVPDLCALPEQLPDPGDADQLLLIRFPSAAATVVTPICSIRGFDRFEFGRWAVTCRSDGVEPVGSPESVVSLLYGSDAVPTADDADRFRSEIGESVANLALARLGRRVLWDDFDVPPTPTAEETHSAADSMAFFDRLVVGGHPIHPGAKLRQGMSATEALSLAPEFADSIQLRFVAIDEAWTLSVADSGPSLTERLYELFPGLADATAAAVPPDRDPDSYAVVPVHPWQFRHVVPDRYAVARRDDRVVPVPSYTRSVSPLLSLRTVVPDPAESAIATPPHLKLAIGVQTTNAVRTLSPSVVADGPQLSQLLQRTCEAASFERFGIRPEPATTCYYPPDGSRYEGTRYDDVRHLGALIRQSPNRHPIVDDGERVVTAASLLSCPPPGDRSVLSALLDAYGNGEETTSRAETVDGFLSAYLDAVVPGPLTLFVKHGIALEAHLQNTGVVFDDGRPVGALVADFGDIRLLEQRLEDASIDLYPGSDVCTQDPDEAREKLWYALFQNHLGELVSRLAATEPVSGPDCWSLVRGRCERVFDRLATDGSIPDDRITADRDSLFASRLVHKPLTAMRLRDVDEWPSTTVANPLANPGER
ncbi:IucA/IucC family siderophore biosynthesis protein [Halostagnicola sp. A56]|uniref:IucA/IucC family protein n=1 Tax=Halostagnicola sp. A56 TaxID=1495067 RepID=UPI0009E5C8DD|nr:IucA/IucC family protein [Halostagnicola sp. A56]